MRVWLDDDRDPENQEWWVEFPQLAEGGWTLARTVDEAQTLIENGGVTFISFDNDLQQVKEGRHLADWIEGKAYWKELPRMGWAVHSKNSVASPLITIAMTNADRFWDEMEKSSSRISWYKLAKSGRF